MLLITIYYCMAKEVKKINLNGEVVSVFPSLAEAAKEANTNKYAISNRVKGRVKSPLNGFNYEYTGIVTEENNFLLNIGDEIEDEKGHIKIIDRFYRKGKGKMYKYECKKCGYIGENTESAITKNHIRCSVCCKNSKVKNKDINTLSATHEWLTKFLVNKEDSEKFTHGSRKKLLTKCPICGNIEKKTINKLVTRGYSCSKCGTSISYPNKFVAELLNRCGIYFEKEKSFSWSNKRRYDFYIPSLNYIIEVDGAQHFYGMGYLSSAQKIIENDREKETLAKNNGISGYFHIDARISDPTFILKSIKSFNELKFIDIDFDDLPEINNTILRRSHIYEEIINEWKNSNISTTEISNKLGISQPTVIKYLKIANKNNVITYSPKEENNKSNKKKIIDLENNVVYESISDCSRKLQVSRPYITSHKERFRKWK